MVQRTISFDFVSSEAPGKPSTLSRCTQTLRSILIEILFVVYAYDTTAMSTFMITGWWSKIFIGGPEVLIKNKKQLINQL